MLCFVREIPPVQETSLRTENENESPQSQSPPLVQVEALHMKNVIKCKKVPDYNNLIGYWKFDKGAGNIIKDYSGKGNDGTFGAISGDTTAYPTWEKL